MKKISELKELLIGSEILSDVNITADDDPHQIKCSIVPRISTADAEGLCRQSSFFTT